MNFQAFESLYKLINIYIVKLLAKVKLKSLPYNHTAHPSTHNFSKKWSLMKGMAKIRLFYSSVMALTLPCLKDINNFVLKLTCSLFTLFINSVCMSVCLWVFGVIRTRPILQTIVLISDVIWTPYPNVIKKIIFIIRWLLFRF